MRLIDSDTLKDTLLKHRYTTEHNQIFRYINEQPTVFHKDKVIEELEELLDSDSVENGLDWNKALNKAIEIVKRGGADD